MTRIDFYDIAQSQRHQLEELVCKLCEKAFSQKKKLLLYTTDANQTDQLDRLLWTNNDESFLPHDQQEQDGFLTPILISHQIEPRGERDLLINLSSEIPSWFAQFDRVLEIVTEHNKAEARAHYSFYKDRGYPLEHHKL